jgi:hypothetical protein
MSGCNQDGITGNGFCSLNSLRYLYIEKCNPKTRAKAKKIFRVYVEDPKVRQFIL